MITKYLIVFLISMVPLIELRGAIPYAVAFHIPTLPAYLIAVIGNMLPVPIIFLFARKVLVCTDQGSRSIKARRSRRSAGCRQFWRCDGKSEPLSSGTGHS